MKSTGNKLESESTSDRHSSHVEKINRWASSSARKNGFWQMKGKFFQQSTSDYLSFLIPEKSRVLSLGCGDGKMLAAVNPSFGLGVDLSSDNIDRARAEYPSLQFVQGDIEDTRILDSLGHQCPFDVLLLEDTLGYLNDVQKFLSNIRRLCSEETRVISVYYGYLWEPLLRLAESFGFRQPSFDTTWLRMADVENFFALSGFETVKREWRDLCPFKLFGIGRFINRSFACFPLVRKLCLRHYLVARLPAWRASGNETVTVVIPCRNEKGNVEAAILRLPELGDHTEVIFIEGHSSDGTWEEIERVRSVYSDLDIKAMQQKGEGKGDAVRAAFEVATGDILVILDADLTVPPEDLPKFVEVLSSGQGEYVNGSRLIYGMEDQAMRFLNFLANHVFALAFTFLLNQRITDTLCGTKALRRKDYQRISKNREYFGDFDPFGDFDLVFGASKLNLKITEVPVRYASRRYGSTQISRFKHGLLLFKMVLFAFNKLKAI